MTRNRVRAACLCVAMALMASHGHGSIMEQNFSADPRLDGWTYPTAAGWTAADGFATAEAGRVWRSPEFAVSPLEYTKISYRSKAPVSVGYVSLVYVNPLATWGIPIGSTTGELIADDYTSVTTSSGWVDHVFYSRAQVNATSAAVRFMGIGSAIQIDNVTVERISSRAEVANWADGVYAQMPATLAYEPDAARFANLPRTAAKLQSGGTLNVVLLGDSIMCDTANSAFDVLVERRNPGLTVNAITAVGGGAGMIRWNDNPSFPELKLQGAVIDQRPDLVMIGGISNGTAYNDIRAVIDKVRAGVEAEFGYTPDILLMTGPFSSNANPLAPGSTWYPEIDPSGTDYRSTLMKIAGEKQTGFLDLNGVWGQYMIDAQGGVYDSAVYDSFFRDYVHANTAGKQILARTLESFLTVAPEPGTLGVLALGGAACGLGRRRRR